MTVEIVKELIDACFLAKRITELTPTLPTGMVPRHNNVIDQIFQLSQEKAHVFISDVSRRLGTTPPSVTKLIGQLEKLGYVVKLAYARDRRFVELKLTQAGLSHYDAFIRSYHDELAEVFSDLDENDCRTAVKVIGMLYGGMLAHEEKENRKPNGFGSRMRIS